MEVRGRSDRFLPTTFLEARAVLYSVSGSQLLCVSGSGAGGQDIFISASPFKGALEFWISAPSLSGGHGCQFTGGLACQAEDKVAVEECCRRVLLLSILRF